MEEISVKLVLLGDTRVGKSSVVLRYIKDEFDNYKVPTIGATFLTKTVKTESHLIKFEIWDTAGQEKYRSMAPLYYRGTSAALVVYDITSKKSFENAQSWIREINEQEGKHVVIGLAGNKLDLENSREVTTQMGETLADENGYIFFETSAKSNVNIIPMFEEIAKEVPNRKRPKRDTEAIEDTFIDEDEPKKKCCNLM